MFIIYTLLILYINSIIASDELDVEFGKIVKGINNKEGYNPRTINNPCNFC